MTTLCRVVGISTSGYYASRARTPCRRAREDAALTELIVAIHRRSRTVYGAPRVHAELRLGHGIACSKKRVARLMRAAKLRGRDRRRRHSLSRGDASARKAPDLVNRSFAAAAPDRLWLTDITYLPTRGGFCYLAVVLDGFSRAVVGWSMRRDLGAGLVVEALEMAILRRRPGAGLVCHSDQGCQYTSGHVRGLQGRAGIEASMGRAGSCYDNALAESFFATLECELIGGVRFRDFDEARFAVLHYLEGFYNPWRRHSALGYLSPADYERRHLAERATGGAQVA